MKRFTDEDWTIGTFVSVTANPGDDFTNDFIGTVTGYHHEHIIVEDQDGNGWYCDAAQLEAID